MTFRRLILLSPLVLLSMACLVATATPVPPPTPSPPPTIAPTLTATNKLPSPTETTTSQPTATPEPTASPTPTPPPISTPTPTPAPVTRPWRIMPLGDSLTSGNYPGGVHSYRGYLEVLLQEAGYSFDFVGTQSRPAHGGADPDNEGHSGYTIGPDLSRFCDVCETANLYDHLADYLNLEPDIILLLVGINDMFPLDVRPIEPADAPQKLKELVERIRQLRPEAYIFLASLAPVEWTDGSDWPEYQALNRMAETIAEADRDDRIFFVDLNRELEAILDKKADFADSVHFAEGGARKMAQVWFEALVGSGLLLQNP